MAQSARDLVKQFDLMPHPEGGWFREIYRSPMTVQAPQGARSGLTTIYYLLERNQQSRWHVVASDEVWHFYGGAPLELLAYEPGTSQLTRHVLKGSAEESLAPVAVIPAGVWQAARGLGDYTLVGCTVGPGFDFTDFQFVVELPDHTPHFGRALASFKELL